MIGPGHFFLVLTCVQTLVGWGPPKKRVPVGHTYSINLSHIFENACCVFGHAGCRQLRWANRNRNQWDSMMLCAAPGLLGLSTASGTCSQKAPAAHHARASPHSWL
ncbi:unnamed protein product [Ixodes pacificus]